MIDLHAHILPSVDDGVRTIEEARELARLAAREGVSAIAATPHVRDDYPTTAARMEEGVEELRRDFAVEGIQVKVLHGGEIAFGRLPTLSPDELQRFTLAQTGRYVLLEFPYYGWPARLEETLFALQLRSVVAILGHPERNADVQKRPERLRPAVDGGALVQLTAASLDGRIGRTAMRTATRLLELGLAHAVASDAHAPAVREAGLAAAVDAVGDAGLARYLTADVPAAVVAGDALPPRPAARRRRVASL